MIHFIISLAIYLPVTVSVLGKVVQQWSRGQFPSALHGSSNAQEDYGRSVIWIVFFGYHLTIAVYENVKEAGNFALSCIWILVQD